MFGDYIDRGSAGAIFSSPTNPDQVIKIINLDSLDDFTKSMNNQQFKFFEKLEEQQKQGIKTPGLPKIEYTFTGEMTPEIMGQMREAVLNHSEDYKDVDTDEYLSGLNFTAIKGNFDYGDKYAIILMDRVSQIGSNYEYTESIGRRGLTPMLRHAHSMGYYVRDLWPANKGMSSDGNIVWFDPMVAPVNPITEEDRKAQRLLLDWNEETQRQYREAVRDQSYFNYEHQAGLFYSESNEPIMAYRFLPNYAYYKALESGYMEPPHARRMRDVSSHKCQPWCRFGTLATLNPTPTEMQAGGMYGSYGTDAYGLKDPTDNRLIGDIYSIDLTGLEYSVVTGISENQGQVIEIMGNIPLEQIQPISYGTWIRNHEEEFESEDDNYWLRGGCGKAAAMISKNLDQKNIPYHYEIGLAYTEEAFIGNHIVVISEKGDQDHYGTQGAKKRWENMLIAELVDEELPPSMLEDIITFEWHRVDPKEDWSVKISGEYLPVSGPMITKDTLGMSAEDENRYHDCANCNRKNVDNEESDEDDACHMVGCGNYFCYQCMTEGGYPIFSLDDPNPNILKDIEKHKTYFGGSSPSVGKCCLQKAINLGFGMYSGYGKNGGWLERLVEDGHLPNQTYVSMNYVLGGVEKMSAEDCSKCNRTNIENDDTEYDEYCGGCGAYLCDECYDGGNNNIRWEMDWPHEWEPPYLSKHETQQHYNNELIVAACCLQKAITYGFVPAYPTVESLKGIMKPYQYVSMNYVLGGLDKMSAESYPTCYLCPKPAKIEVMTAIGMRSFCGNKCRGDYEGIDYGPDDYFISPKLEHQLEVISYRPGYKERNYSEDATIKIQCKNCDYESIDPNKEYKKPASFYRIHPTNTLKVYPDEEDPEYFELVDCDHDMKISNQLVVGEDAWGNMISGEITVRCSKCRFADILRTDLPDGCDNKGRIDSYIKMPR